MCNYFCLSLLWICFLFFWCCWLVNSFLLEISVVVDFLFYARIELCVCVLVLYHIVNVNVYNYIIQVRSMSYYKMKSFSFLFWFRFKRLIFFWFYDFLLFWWIIFCFGISHLMVGVFYYMCVLSFLCVGNILNMSLCLLFELDSVVFLIDIGNP